MFKKLAWFMGVYLAHFKEKNPNLPSIHALDHQLKDRIDAEMKVWMAADFESGFISYQAEKFAGKGAALVFAPHTDDEAIGCGGAIIRHAQNQDPIKVIVLTDGALGNPGLASNHDDPGQQAGGYSAYIAIRREESRKAARLPGYETPTFRDLPDRSLKFEKPLIKRVYGEILTTHSAVVYAPSLYEMHPDHGALARIVLEAGGLHQKVPEIRLKLLYG